MKLVKTLNASNHGKSYWSRALQYLHNSLKENYFYVTITLIYDQTTL